MPDNSGKMIIFPSYQQIIIRINEVISRNEGQLENMQPIKRASGTCVTLGKFHRKLFKYSRKL